MLETIVKGAERMMTHAAATDKGIEVTFADGCRGIIPFSDIPDVGTLDGLAGMELPNPYEINIRGVKGEKAELPWDFARYYCDSSNKQRMEGLAITGQKQLGNRIRAIREAKDITQSELAMAAGIGRITLVRIESGGQSPRYETLESIAEALRVPMVDLVADRGK